MLVKLIAALMLFADLTVVNAIIAPRTAAEDFAINSFGRTDSIYVRIAEAILQPETKMPREDDKGLATRYGTPGDKWLSGPLACGDGSQTIWNTQNVCAHRFLPCGTLLIVENLRTDQRTWCKVWDRGPYGAYVYDESGNRKWVVKKRRGDPGEWRGILDMSPDVSLSMGHNGFEKVRFWTERRLKRIWERNRPVPDV